MANKLNYLSQNAKMKRSSTVYDIYNWGIPAFLSETGLKTCPKAKHCVSGCYARSGTYRFSNVAKKYESRLALTQQSDFIDTMVSEIKTANNIAQKRDKKCLIRIHDSGDFFSDQYIFHWCMIMERLTNIQFYAYTKMISDFNSLRDDGLVPNNLTLIYSYGGSEDHLIDPKRDRHSRVFTDETSLLEAGYADASHNDTVAIGDNPRIGLIYHGSKKYTNTTWDKVSY